MLGILVFGSLGLVLAAECYFLYKLAEQENDKDNNEE
jgi:hypothetical protein